MRRDVYIENDSGGFSVLAASAVEAIIEDGREDDLSFVTSYRAMLLMLQGDDSMPVRVVVDEPLLPDEEAQWLARASWRIDTPDGRILVMGGFDPDVLQWWKDDNAGEGDGRGIGLVEAPPGSWRVDVYAHVGSMNGRHVLDEAAERPGAFFRRCHPGQPFPAWLAQMLDFSGEDDPGHEAAWRDVPGSVKAGLLAIAPEPASVVGLLVHLSRFEGADPEPAEGGWFDADAGRRVPAIFPLGLPSSVRDPGIDSYLDRAFSRPRPVVEAPIATGMTPLIETWSGDTLSSLPGGGERRLALADAFHLHWMAALTADSPPLFEFLVTDAAGWQPPGSTPEFAVVSKGRAAWAIGPPPNAGGWFTWHSVRHAAGTLEGLPDGTTLDLATRRRDPADEDANPAVGRTLYSGIVRDGTWHVGAASPAVTLQVLDEALRFVQDLVERGSITLRKGDERRAFDAAAEIYSPEDDSLSWDGDTVKPADGDERTLLILATSVFRTRFAAHWPMDPIDED